MDKCALLHTCMQLVMLVQHNLSPSSRLAFRRRLCLQALLATSLYAHEVQMHTQLSKQIAYQQQSQRMPVVGW